MGLFWKSYYHHSTSLKEEEKKPFSTFEITQENNSRDAGNSSTRPAYSHQAAEQFEATDDKPMSLTEKTKVDSSYDSNATQVQCFLRHWHVLSRCISSIPYTGVAVELSAEIFKISENFAWTLSRMKVQTTVLLLILS